MTPIDQMDVSQHDVMLSNKMCVWVGGCVKRGRVFFRIAVGGVSLWLGLSPLVARGCFSSFPFNNLLNCLYLDPLLTFYPSHSLPCSAWR